VHSRRFPLGYAPGGFDSFYWAEDAKPSFNFWIWLYRDGGIDEPNLTRRLAEAGELDALGQVPKRHPAHERWAEFVPVWESWKRQYVELQMEAPRNDSPAKLRQHYEAVAAVGLDAFRVEWVMAPIGEVWLLPPETAVLGFDAASEAERRQAVLHGARELRALSG